MAIAPEDRDKIAFSTKQEHWAYRELPFGLKMAPATFQSMMNNVLSGLTGLHCYVFRDDAVIYAKLLSERDVKLRGVFPRFRKYNKLQSDKCKFLRKEVNCLRHLVTKKGVRPDPKKVQTIDNFPKPTCEKQLKNFLGMASYYRRFIPRFSKMAAPLHTLLKKDLGFEWTAEQENVSKP
jgi:hypothetical protein